MEKYRERYEEGTSKKKKNEIIFLVDISREFNKQDTE